VTPAREDSAELVQVQNLALVVVSDPAQCEIGHGLMELEHPQEAGIPVDWQLCCLVASNHGWHGAVGIAASALRLQARDHWISPGHVEAPQS